MVVRHDADISIHVFRQTGNVEIVILP